jgi:hypothetical protein
MPIPINWNLGLDQKWILILCIGQIFRSPSLIGLIVIYQNKGNNMKYIITMLKITCLFIIFTLMFSTFGFALVEITNQNFILAGMFSIISISLGSLFVFFAG